MALAEATALIRASNKKLRGDLRKSRKMFDRSFKKTGKDIRRSLKGALAPLGVAVGVAGVAAIGREVLNFEQTLADLEIQAELSGGQMAELRGTIDELSSANAQSRASLAAASLELVNLQGASGASAEKLRVLSDAALATNTPVQELAGLIFSLENAFGLADPDDLRRGLDAIITAGKKGAIPLGEMNQILQSTGVTFARFSETGVDGAANLAAALQILRKGFGQASEAGTGLDSLLGLIETREIEIGRAGVNVRDAEGNLRELFDTVVDLSEAGIIGDPEKFNAAFGKRKEARKAFLILAETVDQVRELSTESRGSDVIMSDVAKRRETDAFKIKKAFNDMKEAIAKSFTPERIEAFAQGMTQLARLLEFMIDNAEIFIGVWAAFKIGGIVSGFAGISGSLSASALSSKATLGNVGAMAGPLAAVGASAFLLGQALDEALGLSDALAASIGDTVDDIHKGRLEFEALVLEAGGAEFAKEAKAARARAIVAGVRPPRAPTAIERPAAAAPGFPGAAEAAPAAAAAAAAPAAAAGAPAAPQRVDVSVTVDQQGMLRAVETEESKARRSTQ